jgi:tetratricopeptide (TPR) repeat protein/predicted Ser/Thr protein kinase
VPNTDPRRSRGGNAPATPGGIDLDVTLRPSEVGDDARSERDRTRAHPSSGPARGASVGRFVVLDRAGAGGMGVVYVAYDPELDRKVAIKLLHSEPGGESSSGRARLLREAQSMAQLSHPNVAAVYDVGVHADGVYIAMEFIEGQNLVDWLGATTRTWREILDRFIEAGRGIAAAHAVGIVHRDLKPDNIMIGRDGRVRVLDFGLARALTGPRSSDDGVPIAPARAHTSSLDLQLTAPGLVIGTPMYMAPEQHLGREVDERSDQYSFCIAIWEAIHGGRPFSGRSLPEIASNVIEGRILEDKHAKLPGWLRAALRRGIAIDPAARFPSMAALLHELERDRGKTMRGVVGGIAVVATIGVAIAATRLLSAGPEPCDGGETIVGAAWDAERRSAVDAAFSAEKKAYAAESWARVGAHIDAYAAAIGAMAEEACTSTRIRGLQSDEVLGRRMSCLERRVRRLDALTQTLAAGGSSTIQNAVDAVDALPDVAQCADVEALMRGVPPPDDPAIRDAVEQVRDEIEQVRGVAMAGTTAGLEDRIHAVVAGARATGHDAVIAEALLQLGMFHGNFADSERGMVALEEGLDAAERAGHDWLIVETSLALLLGEGRRRGRFAVADLYARRAAAVIERLGNPPGLRQLMYANLAQVENSRGRAPEARHAAEQALAVAAEAGTEDSPRLLPTLNALASGLLADAQLEDADAVLARALDLAQRHVGLAHPNAGVVFANLARLRHAQGRHDEALALFERSADVFVEAIGPDHPNLAALLNGEGLVLVDLARDEEAAGKFAEALQRLQKVYGPDGANLAPALANLGAALTRLGRGREAVPHLQRARAIKLTSLGADSDDLGYADDLLGDAWRAAGEPDEAADAYRSAIAHFERLGGPEDSRAAYGHAGLGRVALLQGDRVRARAELERAWALQDPEIDAGQRGDLRFDLAQIIVDDSPARARELAVAARDDYARAGVRRQALGAALERWLAAHP